MVVSNSQLLDLLEYLIDKIRRMELKINKLHDKIIFDPMFRTEDEK